jgi:hypothetical protein
MSVLNLVYEHAVALDNGAFVRVHCPFCNAKHETSLSLWKDPKKVDTYRFKCWRAACAQTGAVLTNGTASVHLDKQEAAQQAAAKRPVMQYTLERNFDAFPESAKRYLATLGLSGAECERHEVCYVPERTRIAYPIRTYEGNVKGYILRQYIDKQSGGPKVLTDLVSGQSKLGFFRAHGATSTDGCMASFVVEDSASAIRLAELGFDAVAANGMPNNDDATELNGCYWHLIVALDRDATDTALKWLHTNSLLFKSVTLMVLPKDIKNMTHDELVSQLRMYGNRISAIGFSSPVP